MTAKNYVETQADPSDRNETQELKVSDKNGRQSDAVSKYTSNLFRDQDTSKLFAGSSEDWKGDSESGFRPVQSLMGSDHEQSDHSGGYAHHFHHDSPYSMSAQSVMGGDSSSGTGSDGQSASATASSDSSTTTTGATAKDAFMTQIAQSDPALSQVLSDSQAQMSTAGYDQYEQNVYQNMATGAFPDDTSLLEASTYQLQGQGVSSSDIAAAQTVAQTDLATLGDNPVSTYAGTAGTSSGSGSGDSGTSSSSGSGSDTGAASGSGPGAAIGPNGEAVGSTATTFGVDAMPASATAAQGYYVEAGASGSGTGTLGSESNPFSTLQQAQQAMENSDTKTTYVEGGTYNMSSGLNLTSADSGESFIGIGGSSSPAVLDGGGTSGSIVSVDGANNVSVEGLTVQNTAQNLFSWTSADAAFTVNNSSGDNFSYNTIQNVGEAYNLGSTSSSQFDGNAINDVQQAVAMNPGSNGNTIDSNSITNVSNMTGGNDAGAINLDAATNNTISNNNIQNTAEAGIELENWGGVSPNGNSILDNTVINANTAATPSSSYDATGTNPSDMGAIYAWQGAGNAGDNMNLTISGNYVQNAGAGFENVGVYLDDGVSGATVTNNVVQANGSGWDMLVHGGSNDNVSNNVFDLTSATGNEKGVLMQSDGPQMSNDSITGNIFYANGANGGAYTDYSGPSSNIPSNISNNFYWGTDDESFDSSPSTGSSQFANPSSGDYQLEAGSSAASEFSS
ncbi:MAG TPA: hypothetical protein V6C81_06120 [Planktothrix sp.]